MKRTLTTMMVLALGLSLAPLPASARPLTRRLARLGVIDDRLRVIMAMLGALMDQVKDVFIGLGEAMTDAFDNPKQAWDDFKTALSDGYDFIKGQVIDRMIATFTLMKNGIVPGQSLIVSDLSAPVDGLPLRDSDAAPSGESLSTPQGNVKSDG